MIPAPPSPEAQALLALHRLALLAQGADLCDRCGDVIWPEIELVRCDVCVGEHGPPSEEMLRFAMEKHAPRIRADQGEREEEGGLW